MNKIVFLICFCLFSSFAFSSGAIIHVDISNSSCSPCDGQSWATSYSALTTAVGAASTGDTILVAEGTYYPTSGASRTETITLVSGVAIIGGYASGGGAWDPMLYETIVSGDIGVSGDSTDNSYRIFYGSSLDSNTLLKGLTIEQGYMDAGFSGDSYGGAALMVRLSDLSIEQCKFQKNYSYKAGGAIYIGTNSALRQFSFSDCLFHRNESNNAGGAIYNNLGQLTFTNCSFTENESVSNGGAMASKYTGTGALNQSNYYDCTFSDNVSQNGSGGALIVASGDISGCTFTSNSAKAAGALFMSSNTEIYVERCVFEKNEASTTAGAVRAAGGSKNQWIDQSVFFDNNAVQQGGAIYSTGGANLTYITNSVFLNDTCTQKGGALSCQGGKPNIVNCTFAHNYSAKGCVSYSWYNGHPKYSNCIFDSNYAASPTEEIFLYNPYWAPQPAYTTITYSLTDSLYPGDGNATDDVLFNVSSGDPRGADLLWLTADDRYNIVNDPLNPALDAGENDSIPAQVNYDHIGNNRVFNSTVDIGAFEYRVASCPNTSNLYVDAAKTNGDGESWNSALGNLYDALMFADTCTVGVDTIFMAEGTYYTTDDDTARHATLNLVSGLVIIGGYPSGGGVWDPALTETIISGDIGTLGDSTDNTYQIFYGETLDSNTVIKGLTIRGGYMDSTYTADTVGGAAIRFELSYTRIEDCKFENNYSINQGGAVYIGGALFNFDVDFERCTFTNNRSESIGGGVYCRIGDATYQQCSFSNNHGASGGAVQTFFTTSQPNESYFNDCSFTDNTAFSGNGGAVTAGSGHLLDCSFTGNSASIDGGALFIPSHTDILVQGCVFEFNECDEKGGAVLVGGGTAPQHIDRNVFFDNYAGEYGGAMSIAGGGSLKYISNCLFLSDSSGLHGGAIESMGSTNNPNLVNCTFIKNHAVDEGAVSFSWYAAHPKFTNCIFDSNFVNHPAEEVSIYDYGWSNPGAFTITYSATDSVYTGTGNINSSPVYLTNSGDPRGADLQWFTEDDRYNLSLSTSNPVANAGDNASIPSHALADLATQPRINGAAVDMGSYEQSISIDCGVLGDVIYVAQNSVSEDGSSWASAYHNLNSALRAADSCNVDTIKMAQGIYLPTTTTNRERSFELINSIVIMGGYDALGGRDIVAHPTVLSGDIGTSGNIGDNSYHVITANHVEEVVMNGLRVTNGNANSSSSANGGGAAFIRSSEIVFEQCTFDSNRSINGGGALFADSAVVVMFSNCSFSENHSSGNTNGGSILIVNEDVDFAEVSLSNTSVNDGSANNGGGIHASGQVDFKAYKLEMKDNSATENGGGLLLDGVKAFEFTESTFQRNHAQNGGAIWMDETFINLQGSVFRKNTASSRGGAVFADGRRISLVDNQFLRNTAASAGAIYIGQEAQTSITGSVFFRNRADSTLGGAILNESGDFVEIINTALVANSAKGNGGAIAINQLDIHREMAPENIPTNLVNVSIVLNHSQAEGGGVFASSDSVEFSLEVLNSIFWKNTDADTVWAEVADKGGIKTRIRWSLIDTLESDWDPGNTSMLGVNPDFVAGSLMGVVDTNGLAGPDTLWMTSDDGLQLSDSSLAIDFGDRPWIPQSIEHDLSQNLRLMGEGPDIGSYEFPDEAYSPRQLPAEDSNLLTFLGCPDLPITDSIDVTDPDFGADGSDLLDDTYAFIRVSQYIREHYSDTARLLVKIPNGTYIVGSQFPWNDASGYLIASNNTSLYDDVTIHNPGLTGDNNKILYSEPVFNLDGVSNVTIQGGESAVLVAPDSIYYGYLSTQSILQLTDSFGITGLNEADSASYYKIDGVTMFRLNECECIEVSSVELDGNAENAFVYPSSAGLIFGGYDGVFNQGSDKSVLNDLEIHQFGRDGIQVHRTDVEVGTLPVDNIVNNVHSYLNGRSGMSWTAGRNLIVLHSDFSQTALTALGTINNSSGNGAGLDIEPELGDCMEGYFYRTNFHDCSGAPIILTTPGQSFYAKTRAITFDECEIWGRNSFSMSIAKSSNLNFTNCVIRGGIKNLSGGAANDYVKFDSCFITDVGVLGNNALDVILHEKDGLRIEPWNATNNFYAFENCTFAMHYGKFCEKMDLDLDHWYTRSFSCNQFQFNSSTYTDTLVSTLSCSPGYGFAAGALTQSILNSNTFIDLTPIDPTVFSLLDGSCDMIYLNFSNDPAINKSDGSNSFYPQKPTQRARLTRLKELNSTEFTTEDF